MKFIAFMLLSSLSVALVLAFPDNNNEIADMPAVGHNADAVTNTGEGGSAATSETDQLREPRHLLKKLFQPQVIVQPIYIQPSPYYRQSYYGSGRGYNGYGRDYGYNKW